MRKYDLVMVLRSSLSDAERKKLIEGVKAHLKGMKFTKEEEWGQKPLAYTIKKELAGYYYLFQFETENSVTEGLEKRLLTNDNVLRHLLLRTK
jgi:small subunit ribosomal protein S6